MAIVLVLISLLIIAVGVALIIKTDVIVNFVKTHADSRALHVFSVVGRILFGLVLLMYAEHSRLPWLMQLLGILAVLAGLIFALWSQKRFSHFVVKIIERYGQTYGRFAGMAIVAFGALLLFLII